MRALALCCLLAGCGVRIADAPGGGGGDDAPAPPDAPGGGSPDAAQVCANGRAVYLNFDGATLTAGAPSDATLNRASWMSGITQGTAPAFKAGVAGRDQLIKDITGGVNAQLASLRLTVVTQRPATGPYVMIVIGGTAGAVGSRYGVAVNTLDCGDAQKSDLAWITDTISTQRVVNSVLGAIGFGIGLTATTDPLDCMCAWDNNCSPDNTQPCRLTPGIARDPTARQLCTGQTTQDEVAAFNTAFCQ